MDPWHVSGHGCLLIQLPRCHGVEMHTEESAGVRPEQPSLKPPELQVIAQRAQILGIIAWLRSLSSEADTVKRQRGPWARLVPPITPGNGHGAFAGSQSIGEGSVDAARTPNP